MRELKTIQANMGSRQGRRLNIFFACIMLVPMLMCGCSHFNEGYQAKETFIEANDYFSQGNYTASLGKYQQIIEKFPTAGDRVLFEMGIIYSHPGNEQRDYQKSLECFRKIITDYPASGYRKDSEVMTFNIDNVIAKDRIIAAQKAFIESLRQDLTGRGAEIAALNKEIDALKKEMDALAQVVKSRESEIAELKKEPVVIPKGPADRVLIEKKDRRLTLISNGRPLKTYQIALGGNPIGPKERQGDNKTPEGTYVIDSRNKNSRYHLALHISYPNEKDKRRARELGVSPGGDIMIHGIKNGFSWAGELHAEVDWTKGCIAVTDEEIEEIDRLVPNGTSVEIRP